MGSSETESDVTGSQNPDWETDFYRFEQAISSGSASIRVRSVLKLSDFTNQAPDSILSRSIPILAGLLRVSDDPNRSVQATAAHCLKRIACRGGEEGGRFAVTMGRCGVTADRLGGLEIVIRELNTWEDDSSRWCLLEILSALATIRESRRVLAHSGRVYYRPVTEAGAIPLYVELLSGDDPMGKDIAEDVFSILAVAEGNAVLIAEQLVRIVREGDNDSKLAASDDLWDLASYKHSVSVIRDSGAIPLLIELLRDGSLNFKERISGAITQLSYNENDRKAFSDSSVIPILIEWLEADSEELRHNAAESLINFSEDQEHYGRLREAIRHPVFQNMRSTLY
ncbi:unnamed protein product [Cochlearia groenlandica]